MATITKTPQDIFGEGQQGDEFFIDASDSTFGIISYDNVFTSFVG